MKLFSILVAVAPDMLALLSLVAIGGGCYLERPSAGLIVPGSLVFGCLAFNRLRRRDTDAA